MIKQRQTHIHNKGFDMTSAPKGEYVLDVTKDEVVESPKHDFSSLRVGARKLEDTLVNLGSYKKVNANYGNKQFVLNAIYKHDYKSLREISNYFYESSGIYYRLCNYLAKLYRYDWYVTPYVEENEKGKNKILRDFSKVLTYLDQSDVKRLCDRMALDVIKEGAYYGTIVDFGDKFGIQKLPATYCRSRYYSGTVPIVELNLQFFDIYFPNWLYRSKVLQTFPEDIQQAYVLWKQGKLPGDYPGDRSYWYPLDPDYSVKLSLNDSDIPAFVSVIPSIIDLDQAQELDRQKTMQQLLKILVQKLPLDKNGDLIFDVDEAKDIHNNAVAMLKRAVGIDVLTTFADIEKIDTKDANSATSTDDLEKVERTVYNNAGVSHNLFNADGNLATTNAILVDEAHMRDLPLQFAGLLTRVVSKFNRANHYSFTVSMLETTQFNYKDLSKLYKDQMQIGGPKLLSLIALGQSQSSILATLTFENEILNLADIMIPPMMSSTMSGKDLGKSDQSNTNKIQNKQTDKVQLEEKQNGRPEKDDSEKSDKTILNKESQ